MVDPVPEILANRLDSALYVLHVHRGWNDRKKVQVLARALGIKSRGKRGYILWLIYENLKWGKIREELIGESL